MNAFRVRIHALTIVLATSYLTLGAANAAAAERVWWIYGMVTFVLAVTNVTTEHRHHNGR